MKLAEKDLRSGNRINVLGEDKSVSAMLIATFNYDSKDIKPIPLTEEWLVKFGLKRSDTDLNRFYMCDVDIYIFTDKERKPTHIVFNPSSGTLYVTLLHAHQLLILCFDW